MPTTNRPFTRYAPRTDFFPDHSTSSLQQEMDAMYPKAPAPEATKIGQMKAQGLIGCCGAVVFHNFGHCPSHAHVKSAPLEEINEWMEKYETHYRKLKYAFAMATLSGAQTKALGDLFTKRGWVSTEGGRNDSYIYSDVFLWKLTFTGIGSDLEQYAVNKREYYGENA